MVRASHARRAAIVALSLAGMVACAPGSTEQNSDAEAGRLPSAATSVKPQSTASPTGMSATGSTKTPNAARSPSEIRPERVDGVFVATLKKALAITLVAPTGTVSVKYGCLIATVDGVDKTAVLPPQARLVGPSSNPTAIKLSRQTVPLGSERALPAGGADVLSSDLQLPIPSYCPRALLVFAG